MNKYILKSSFLLIFSFWTGTNAVAESTENYQTAAKYLQLPAAYLQLPAAYLQLPAAYLQLSKAYLQLPVAVQQTSAKYLQLPSSPLLSSEEKLFINKTFLELYADSDFNSGIKFKSPFLNSSLFINFKDYVKSTQNDSQQAVKEKKPELHNTYGFHLFTDSFCSILPCQIKFGKLNFSGSLSKINNPLISNFSSPFSFSPMSVSGVSASLPSYSSYTKPLGIFLEGGYKNKNTILQRLLLNYWTTEKKAENTSQSEGFSSTADFSFPFKTDKLKISAAVTAGIFSYEENSSTKWLLPEAYYSSGKNLCTSIQFSIQFKKLYFCFLDNTYQNPFNEFNSIFRSDFKYNGKHFTFCLNGLYSPAQIIKTPSEKKITRQSQLAASLQYKTMIKKIFIKTGVGGNSTFYFQDQNRFPFSTEEKELCTEWKLCYGLSISSAKTSVNFTTSINGNAPLPFLENNTNINSAKIKNQNKIEISGINAQIKNNYYFSKISPAILFSAALTPKEDFSKITSSYKTSLYLSSSTNPQFSGNTSFSFSVKDEKITSKKISGTLTAGLKIRQINIKGKVSFEIKLVE